MEDVLTVLENEPLQAADAETRAALEGYRDAMAFILPTAPDLPRLSESLLRSLHFMMMKHDLSKHPGRWRPGAVHVAGGGGQVLYTAPDRALVEGLVVEALGQGEGDAGPAVVRAAFTHLNLVMIHPFSDGNGRIARVAQSYVLAEAGDLSPVFQSIEEYLGRNTGAYYAVLRDVGGTQWDPAARLAALAGVMPHRPLPASPHPAAAHPEDRGAVGSRRAGGIPGHGPGPMRRGPGRSGPGTSADPVPLPEGHPGRHRRDDLGRLGEPRPESLLCRRPAAAGR